MEEGLESQEALHDLGEEARSCLEWILSGMGVEGSVELAYRDGQVVLDAACGEDSSIVIGRRGQTLEALQTLVSRIASRKFPQTFGRTRILIDIEGYRDRRRTNLIEAARRAAEDVRETGEPTFLDPLNSYERYLVHDALKGEEGIITTSRGEGAMKQVLISLAPQEEA